MEFELATTEEGALVALANSSDSDPMVLSSIVIWAIRDGEQLELPLALMERRQGRDGSTTALGALATGRGRRQLAFDMEIRFLPQQPGVPWIEAEARVTSRCPQTVECAVQIPFLVSAPDVPRWLIPGMFYGDNGYDPANIRVFPRYSPEPPEDADPFVSSFWSFRADRCASPVVFAGIGDHTCFIATDEQFSHGMSGVGFDYTPFTDEGDDPEGAPAILSLYYPWRETPVSYADHKPDHMLGEVNYVELEPGEEMTFSFRFGVAPDVDRYGFAPVLRSLYNRASPDNPPAPWMDTERAAELAAFGNYTWFYDSAERVLVETCSFDKYFARGRALPGYFDRGNMHVSWNSGIAYAHALARWGEENGRPEYLEAGNAVIERICTEGTAPCGAFWGQWNRSKEGGPGWDGGWNPDPLWLHARTLGEACSFLIDAIV